MRSFWLTVTLVALLLPCVARAQLDWEGTDDSGKWRLSAGWADLGDADSGLTVAAERTMATAGNQWLVGIQWAEGEISVRMPETGAAPASVHTKTDVTVIGLGAAWVKEFESATYKWYGGAGVNWFKVDNADNTFGIKLLAGMNFSERYFAQLGYRLATDVGNSMDIDGLELLIGTDL